MLELTMRAVEIQDLVVTSFLFLEKNHRVKEREYGVRSDAVKGMTLSYAAVNYGV